MRGGGGRNQQAGLIIPEAAANFIYPSAVLVGVLGIWEFVTVYKWLPRYILPQPSAIAEKMMVVYWELLYHAWITGVEIILGFGLALLVGVGLAVAVVYARVFEMAFYPWIIVTQAVPKIAIGPLLIIWFGYGLLPKVLIAALISFFPILIGTVAGLRSVERESIFLLQSMGAGRAKTFWYLRLPHGLPNLFAGMKVGIVLAAVGALVGEFVGANQGLGYVLLLANAVVDTELLFCALIIISLLAIMLYAVVECTARVCLRWHVSVRETGILGTA